SERASLRTSGCSQSITSVDRRNGCIVIIFSLSEGSALELPNDRSAHGRNACRKRAAGTLRARSGARSIPVRRKSRVLRQTIGDIEPLGFGGNERMITLSRGYRRLQRAQP